MFVHVSGTAAAVATLVIVMIWVSTPAPVNATSTTTSEIINQRQQRKTDAAPNSINPTLNSSMYDYEYGYQYVANDVNWHTPKSTLSPLWYTYSCALFDYSSTTAYGQLKPSVLYSITAEQIGPTREPADLYLFVARDASYWHDVFAMTQVREINIPPSETATGLIYFFPVDQLIQVSAGDYLGYCDCGDSYDEDFETGVISSKNSDTHSAYVYPSGMNEVKIGSQIRGRSSLGGSLKVARQVDLRVHGWADLTIGELDLTAVNEFLVSSTQTAGGVRVVPPTTSSGGLTSGGRLALIVCMAVLGVGILTTFMIIRNRRRPVPAPISHPPKNHHVPDVIDADRIQPKPAFVAASLSSPIRVQAASSPSAPISNHPSQSQPIIYRGNQDGIRINLPAPPAPPNPYLIHPSSPTPPPPPSVSPAAASSSSAASSIELLRLNRRTLSLSSLEIDILNQPPPQYSGLEGVVSGESESEVGSVACVNMHLEQSPSMRSSSVVQSALMKSSPTPISPIPSPSTLDAAATAAEASVSVSAPLSLLSYPSPLYATPSSLMVTPTPILVSDVTPEGGSTVLIPHVVRFCDQCGLPKVSSQSIFCPNCGNKY